VTVERIGNRRLLAQVHDEVDSLRVLSGQLDADLAKTGTSPKAQEQEHEIYQRAIRLGRLKRLSAA
jgi:hypothetical protein